MRSGMRWNGTIVLAAAVAMMVANDMTAYPRYNDGCQNCHGAFTDGTSPQGTVFPSNNKHVMHKNSQNMNTQCDLCHTSGDNRNPWLGSSDGTANNPGLGCTGCHGRDYGGAIGNSGVGLRAHHAANGVSCSACHPGDPVPLPENVLPTYYGTVDTNADDPCNSAPNYLENWSIGDTQGQDNDGDNVYDGADPDCAPPLGDIDGDGDVDLDDLALFVGCLNGPNVATPPAGCDPADFTDADLNGDNDVDLGDFGEFQKAFTG